MARDLRFDSIRGLLLFDIAIVHTQAPIAQEISYALGFASVAAGFIFLSGLVSGLVFVRAYAKGWKHLVRKCTKRFGQIYLYHLVAFAVVVALALLAPQFRGYVSNAFGPLDYSPAITAMMFLTFSYQPPLFDIIPLYAVYVLILPIFIFALEKGRGEWALSASFAIWATCQFWPDFFDSGGAETRYGFFNGLFNPLAWQFVFFSGVYLGYQQLHRGRELVRFNFALVLTAISICVIGLASRWQLFDVPSYLQLTHPFLDKTNYGLFQAVNFAAFVYLLSLLAKALPHWFIWRPFAFLGQHSLVVFSAHVVVIYVSYAITWRFDNVMPYGASIVAVLMATSLFIPAWIHRKYLERCSN